MMNGMELHHPEPPEELISIHGEQIRYFHSRHHGFHNCYRTRIILLGHVFTSVEQYVCWQKARFFGDYEIAQQVLVTSNHTKVRRLAQRVRGFDLEKWRQIREEVSGN